MKSSYFTNSGLFSATIEAPHPRNLRLKILQIKKLSVANVKKFLSGCKVLILIFMACIVFMACNSNRQKTGNDLQADKDSIMAAIQRETNSFFARDYEAWKSNYVQSDYAFQAWSNRDGTFDASVGWDAIDKVVGNYIHENPEPESSHPIVERKNIKYKFYGNNVAFLTWDQFNSDREKQNFTHSKEVRIMEKVNGQWKIACVSAFWDFKNLIRGDKLKDIQRMEQESRGKGKI